MTPRDKFLAERLTGIGGSDCASLFNVGWGCRRRLWYQKRETPEDYPREETEIMELGNILEPFFGRKYEAETGNVTVFSRSLFRREAQPELIVHVDAFAALPGDRSSTGIAEIKSVGRGAWFKYKRTGLPEDYVLQLQHGMLVTQCSWGVFIIGCRDTGQILHWEVKPDATIQGEIRKSAGEFWNNDLPGLPPDRLNPDDARCQECSYRRTCQGENVVTLPKSDDYQVDDSLLPLVMQRIERTALVKEAKEMLDDINEELKALLGDRTLVRTARGDKMQYYEFTKKAYAVPEHIERPLRVYPAKERG